MNSKSKILERIAKGAQNNQAVQSELEHLLERAKGEYYPPLEGSLDCVFVNELEKIGGKVFVCNGDAEFLNQLKKYCHANAVTDIHVPDKKMAFLIQDAGIKQSAFSSDDGATVLTDCEFLVARTGSVMMSSKISGGRKVLSFAEKQLIFARENQLVEDIQKALVMMKEKYADLPSQITNVTGQSRTADIEKTLVMGAHGPRELVVFLVKG